MRVGCNICGAVYDNVKGHKCAGAPAKPSPNKTASPNKELEPSPNKSLSRNARYRIKNPDKYRETMRTYMRKRRAK